MSWTCPNCTLPNKADRKLCKNCGSMPGGLDLLELGIPIKCPCGNIGATHPCECGCGSYYCDECFAMPMTTRLHPSSWADEPKWQEPETKVSSGLILGGLLMLGPIIYAILREKK